METDITVKNIQELLKEIITELQKESEFQLSGEKTKYALDKDGNPNVKIAIANVPLDFDLWRDLRNPATIGLHPAGLREIWEFYTTKRSKTVDESGRQTIFKVPFSFDYAIKNYSRAVIISIMLPFSQDVMKNYIQIILKKKYASSHLFAKMYEVINQIIDKAITRAAINLVSNDNIVVALNNENIGKLSSETIPLTRQGNFHGPCKNGNFPQKSIAILTGLGQFGISRGIIKDELINGNVERFTGPIRSIVIFDRNKLITNKKDGILNPTNKWREFILKLSDFTNTDEEINKYRFCTYIPYKDSGCGTCIHRCPSGALGNSVSTPSGSYSEQIIRQKHRFWDGKLQFDFGKCCQERGQMGSLFPEWSCARCVSFCATTGKRRTFAAEVQCQTLTN